MAQQGHVSKPNDWAKVVKERAGAGFQAYLEDRGSPVRLGRPPTESLADFALGRTNFTLVAWNLMASDRPGAIVDGDVHHSGVPEASAPMPDEPVTIRRLRLRHPDLVFHIDVILTEHEGRWLATAMLADEPEIGTGTDPREAHRAALAALREPYASELAEGAELPA